MFSPNSGRKAPLSTCIGAFPPVAVEPNQPAPGRCQHSRLPTTTPSSAHPLLSQSQVLTTPSAECPVSSAEYQVPSTRALSSRHPISMLTQVTVGKKWELWKAFHCTGSLTILTLTDAPYVCSMLIAISILVTSNALQWSSSRPISILAILIPIK